MAEFRLPDLKTAGFILATTLVAYNVLRVLYNFLFHPLAKYPGPLLWRISRLPYAISLATGNLVHDTWAIHNKYGKVVRLAPDELSFIDREALHDIYGARGKGHSEFTKNPAWVRPAPNGVFSILDSFEDDHTRQRKILNHAFSPGALKAQEPFLQKYTGLLIAEARKRGSIDLKDWYNFTTFDITGDLTFGQSFECLEKGRYHRWVSFLFAHLKASCLLASITFYPFFDKILWYCIPKSAFNERIYHFGRSVEWVHKRLSQKTDRNDFMSYVSQNNEKGEFTMKEIEATAGTLVIAGSETTSTVLLSTTRNLMIHKEKMEKLKKEIRGAFKDESEITLKAVENLPYLAAVFQENFRYTPPVPCSIPRTVPDGGDTIAGDMYPGGTFVGFPQIAAYRSHHHFAHPNEFIPERWLPSDHPLYKPTNTDPEFSKDTFKDDNFKIVTPFSVGPRMCIAQILAYAEMKLILGRMLWNFDFKIPQGKEQEYVKPWVEQKTYGLWVKEPYVMEMVDVVRE
ncbi:Cytochrome P450 monooxygenase aclL [Lachnellula suecica]|uniref:Cytochrome P450 monooxygenase aclL n=1 Tax=Lachnellula suecica TaxID=602035 RepID=A0A8T9CHC0_9HELO|nr:Cytochrome P450 monooxygenase aclL [Lachnellula suecica]